MKDIKLMIFTVFAALGILAFGQYSQAQNVGWDGAVWVQAGNYAGNRRVALSSHTPTAIFPVDGKRPDSICFNNGAYNIFVGSTSVAYQRQEHPIITDGYPIVSSGTIRTAGTFSGALYGVCDAGVSSCEMRCLDGKVN